MNEVQQLIADVKMTNNGYIFTSTHKQVKIASDNPTIFRLFGVGFNGNQKISLK